MCPPEFLGRRVQPTAEAFRKNIFKRRAVIVGESLNKRNWWIIVDGNSYRIDVAKSFVEDEKDEMPT